MNSSALVPIFAGLIGPKAGIRLEDIVERFRDRDIV